MCFMCIVCGSVSLSLAKRCYYIISMNLEKKKVTLLIPCFNEEQVLPLLIEKVYSVVQENGDYNYELLFINDGSTDSTLDIIEQAASKDSSIHYVSLSRNFGKEAAMLAGFDYAKGDCVIIMDADMQDPPELMQQMLNYWSEGYEDVYAKRRTRGRESWIRKQLSLTFYSILQHSSRVDVLPNVGDFRLLDKKCIEALRELRETDRYTKGMFAWIGFKKKEILFDRGDRAAGTSAWNLRKLLELGIDGLTSFTTSPLRISTFLGAGVSFLAFIYLFVILTKTLIWGDPVAGYPSLMAVILFLGGVQLLCIGIMGEYLARVFNESKKRPVYVIAKTNIK